MRFRCSFLYDDDDDDVTAVFEKTFEKKSRIFFFPFEVAKPENSMNYQKLKIILKHYFSTGSFVPFNYLF